MDQEKEQNKEARREIGELVSWAEAFDDAEPETRRMIIARLVERIDIGADYSISIRFRISMKQYTGEVSAGRRHDGRHVHPHRRSDPQGGAVFERERGRQGVPAHAYRLLQEM